MHQKEEDKIERGDSMKLTPKQQAFADYYIQSGNGSESYKKAYSTCKKDETARVNASKLLTNTNVIKYIEERNKQIQSNRIADTEEIKTFWTNMLRNEGEDPKNRLKASEYLAKTKALFIDKVEQNTTASVSVKSDLDDLSIEELEKIEQILSKPK